MPCGCAKTRGPTPHQCSTSPHGVLTNGSLSPLEGKQHPQEVLHFALAGLCASAERLYVMTHSRVHIFSIAADSSSTQ